MTTKISWCATPNTRSRVPGGPRPVRQQSHPPGLPPAPLFAGAVPGGEAGRGVRQRPDEDPRHRLRPVCPPGTGLPAGARLREVRLGDWEERTWAEISRADRRMYEDFNKRPHLWRVEGAETFAQVRDRMVPAVRDIAAGTPRRDPWPPPATAPRCGLCWGLWRA